MLNCRLVVDVGSDFDSLNFAPFRLPYSGAFQFPATINYSQWNKISKERTTLRGIAKFLKTFPPKFSSVEEFVFL